MVLVYDVGGVIHWYNGSACSIVVASWTISQ